jgi:single-stranded-DNA-specific exonuclease
MQKQYRVRERQSDNLLEHLLLSRGVSKEQFQTFLTPDFERDSHDPFLLPDMGAAVERILFAKEHGETIAVWSDYDADGVPGGVMLSQFLRSIGVTTLHYIPHRHEEGFGLNNGGIEKLHAQGAKIIITVDCGTSDVEPIAFARQKGIDTIVTDHHEPPKVLPEALIINPKRADSKYPFLGLCGSGVAWKLVQAILSTHRPPEYAEGREKWLLDLVGIATLSDRVPLIGENRMLAHFGLKVLRRARRPGLAALLKLLRIAPRTLTEDDIGFMISPRLNAASRMDSPELAARLLATDTETESYALARELDAMNNERKGVVAATVKEANKRLMGGSVESPVIVMGSPQWRPGILGLVASSLSEAHGKPVFLWGRDGSGLPQEDALLRGSCRSASVSVVEIMEGARDVFEEYGGHHASGGFSLPQERVHMLSEKLSSSFLKLVTEVPMAEPTWLDRELSLSEVAHALRDMQKMAPFGEGNAKPLMIFPNVSVGAARVFGKQQNHLEFALTGSDTSVAGIAFFSTPDSFSKKVSPGDRADIVGHVELDWRNRPRIRIVDVL